MRTSLRLLSFLAAALPAVAAPAPPHWLQVTSPHFTVITNSGEKDARHVAAQFERMRAVFQILMPSSTDDPASPIVVLALKDTASFRALEPAAYLSKNSLNLAGYFLRTQDKNYVLLRLDAQGDHPYSVVYHEYTHYMLRKADEWLPLWLNEGLAEFYQNTSLDTRDVRVGEPSVEDILYLRQSSLLPLTTLLAVDHSSPYYHDEQKGSVFYAESWALTHYLEVGDYEHKTNLIRDYERLLQKHEDPVSAAAKAFGDLKQLEQNLNNYIRGGSFKEFKLTTPVAFTDESFAVQPLPATQADAIRADVLVDVDRTADAETLLHSILAADPANAEAHEVMGSLKFRQHDIPAALDWYSQAVKLDSHSYLAHYYFAVSDLQSGSHTQDAAVEQSLKTAIDLNPRFAPSYDALAHVYSMRHDKLDEAHMLNLKAVQLEPENVSYRYNAAEVLVEQGKLESAIDVLKAAQRIAKEQGESHMLNSRIAQLERYKSESGPDSSAPLIRRTLTSSAPDTPGYPEGPPTGQHRTLTGTIRAVKCLYPAILTLTFEPDNAKPIALYTNNYTKVSFYAPPTDPDAEILPCSTIAGMKASIDFGEVTDPRVAGQILSIYLSK